MSKKFFYLASLCLLVSVGCQSPHIQDINDTAPLLTTGLDPYAVRVTTEFMVDSMLQFPAVIELTSLSRPVLDLGDLNNRTSQRIDERLITQNIRTRLIRSGQFRFVDRTQIDYDADSHAISELGFVDRSLAPQPGQQVAAELYLYGDILEMRTEGRNRHYFQIQLNLRDLRSGEIIWSDIREVHRQRNR